MVTDKEEAMADSQAEAQPDAQAAADSQ
eukprot:SAG11_NODE_30936_length_296_cov_0.786802_1_plen_27_part_10